MNNLKKNPKGSNMYSIINAIEDTTPMGSNNNYTIIYKHKIPSGLIK